MPRRTRRAKRVGFVEARRGVTDAKRSTCREVARRQLAMPGQSSESLPTVSARQVGRWSASDRRRQLWQLPGRPERAHAVSTYETRDSLRQSVKRFGEISVCEAFRRLERWNTRFAYNITVIIGRTTVVLNTLAISGRFEGLGSVPFSPWSTVQGVYSRCARSVGR